MQSENKSPVLVLLIDYGIKRKRDSERKKLINQCMRLSIYIFFTFFSIQLKINATSILTAFISLIVYQVTHSFLFKNRLDSTKLSRRSFCNQKLNTLSPSLMLHNSLFCCFFNLTNHFLPFRSFLDAVLFLHTTSKGKYTTS